MTALNREEQAFWEACLHSNRNVAQDAHVFASMPGNEAIADDLIPLYLSGIKTAGSALVADYEKAGEPLPRVGDYWIMLDAGKKPVCVARVTQVLIKRFCDVGEDIARAEGEGDLSLEFWREGHRRFFEPLLKELEIGDLNQALLAIDFVEVVYRR